MSSSVPWREVASESVVCKKLNLISYYSVGTERAPVPPLRAGLESPIGGQYDIFFINDKVGFVTL